MEQGDRVAATVTSGDPDQEGDLVGPPSIGIGPVLSLPAVDGTQAAGEAGPLAGSLEPEEELVVLTQGVARPRSIEATNGQGRVPPDGETATEKGPGRRVHPPGTKPAGIGEDPEVGQAMQSSQPAAAGLAYRPPGRHPRIGGHHFGQAREEIVSEVAIVVDEHHPLGRHRLQERIAGRRQAVQVGPVEDGAGGMGPGQGLC